MRAVLPNLYKVFLLFVIFFALGVFHKTFAQCNNEPSRDWYCDKRLKLNLQVGTVTEILPFKVNDKNKPIIKFSSNDIEYKVVNIVKFKTLDFYTNTENLTEAIFYSVQNESSSAKDFNIGEKYLFEIDSLGVNHFGKGSYEYQLNYIRPNGFIKLYADANEEIELFKKAKNFDIYEEILEVNKSETISGGVVSGKAYSLPKPSFPKNMLALKSLEAVKVLVLIGEDGIVVKSKAVCTSFPLLAKSAEQAAMRSRFAPTKIKGKAVKVTGSIIYNFAP